MNLDKNTPRLLGAAFLLQAVASLVSGFILLEPLIVVGNITESMTKIADNASQMRANIVGELVTAIGIVLLATLLYSVLKEQNKIIARWAFGLRIAEATILAVSRISAFSLLYTSQEYVKAGVLDSSYFQTLGSLFYESMEYAYTINMLFFSLGGLLFYYLLLESKYIPKLLSNTFAN